MIDRARPRYITDDMYDIKMLDVVEEHGSLYFTYSHDGFRFFLEKYNAYYNKRARVAIQDYTCSSMLEAIIKSGSIAYIFDVSLEDASLLYDEVYEKADELDVIVLTHYQGVPNKDYIRFASLSKKNNIILFEDLAHITESYTDGIRIGSLGNVYLESYRFDKPFVAIRGGALHVNSLDPGFEEYLWEKYIIIPKERENKAKKDLILLRFLMEYTKPGNYYEDIDHSLFIGFPQLMFLYNRGLWKNRVVRKIIALYARTCGYLCRKVFKERKIRRANELRIAFVQKQREFYETLNKKSDDYKTYFEIKERELGKGGDIIKWNRYSIIDEDNKVENCLRMKGICAGRYNWSSTLSDHVNKRNSRQIIIFSNKNSKYLKAHMINIPVWQLD